MKNHKKTEHKMPDFLIIGAMKAGSTSLYQYLIKHPSVEAATRKEVHYFDNRDNYDLGPDWYRNHFPLLFQEKPGFITGEASPTYLPFSHVPKRVFKVMPKAKILVLLRNPVDRAYSHYHHSIRKGKQTLSFEDAITLEESKILKKKGDNSVPSSEERNKKYIRLSMYADQLEKWLKVFPREQFLILSYEEFFRDPNVGLQKVLGFLNLPTWEWESFKQHNSGGQYVEMDPGTRERLVQFFKPYNQKLYRLLGMKFDWDK